MGIEEYSRKAFEENEKKIAETEKRPEMTPFGLEKDGLLVNPADAIDAKVQNMEAKRERRELMERAHEEAIAEDQEHSFTLVEDSIQGQSYLRLGDYERVEFTTESGNEYKLERTPDGTGYLMKNRNLGKTTFIPIDVIMDTKFRIGCSIAYGTGGKTTRIKSGKVYQKKD